MDGILFFAFVSLTLLLLVLGLLLGYTLLFRTDFFWRHVFPEVKPKASLFFSKEKGAGDLFILYFGSRTFLACAVALCALFIFRSITLN